MAGMEDYEFYSQLQRDSPFWERRPGGAGDAGVPQQPGAVGPYPMQHQPNFQPASYQDDQDTQTQKVAGLGVGVVGLLTENLLIHPFVVLRRQCQVNVNSRRYHFFPFALVPVAVRLASTQGVTALWKGIGSVLVVRGLTMAVEDMVSKVTPWPKDVTGDSTFKAIGQHLLLKCISLAVVTPFYSASLVETVQSEIASERPGIFDVFREGMVRAFSWSAPQTGRLLPVWVLVVPTVAHGMAGYCLATLIQGATLLVWRSSRKEGQRRRGAVARDNGSSAQSEQMMAGVVGQCVADAVMFPLETVLHRLHLQGTRTIIDNLDSGQEVVPILTNYGGVGDCMHSILLDEGTWGLFKGFGALVLQYAVQACVFKAIHAVVGEVASLFKPPTPPQPQPAAPPTSEPAFRLGDPPPPRSALTHPTNRVRVVMADVESESGGSGEE